MAAIEQVRTRLGEGLVIPACPLALDARRQLDERRQRALFRYYLAAGAGGLAVGVHTTQFAIRSPRVNLFRPVLELAAEELRRSRRDPAPEKSTAGEPAVSLSSGERARVRASVHSNFSEGSVREENARPHPGPLPRGEGVTSSALDKSIESRHRQPSASESTTRGAPLGIAGICGQARQAVAEATLIRELGFHAGLLSLGALGTASESALLSHCRRVAGILPIIGFYLQPAAGGRALPYSFWRRFVEIENVVAIKIAPFNRYQTLDVLRAVIEAGRDDIALYTGNDDNIVVDLLTPFRFGAARQPAGRRIVGGLLGHWAVWTKRAVELHAECRRVAESGEAIPVELLRRAVEVTDCNAAFFDAANGYAGCIPGLHEVLRRQGLLKGIWCLDRNETLSPGQREEIDRVHRAYPHLNDDEFVSRHRDEWLRG